jgi:hypothetical protein
MEVKILRPEGRTTSGKACHPCAGAMLIFSVSFQFYYMSPEGDKYSTPDQGSIDFDSLRIFPSRLSAAAALTPSSGRPFEIPRNVHSPSMVLNNINNMQYAYEGCDRFMP